MIRRDRGTGGTDPLTHSLPDIPALATTGRSRPVSTIDLRPASGTDTVGSN